MLAKSLELRDIDGISIDRTSSNTGDLTILAICRITDRQCSQRASRSIDLRRICTDRNITGETGSRVGNRSRAQCNCPVYPC
ncbi:hypothetical protein D3C80_421900 [compost metagenome]